MTVGEVTVSRKKNSKKTLSAVSKKNRSGSKNKNFKEKIVKNDFLSKNNGKKFAKKPGSKANFKTNTKTQNHVVKKFGKFKTEQKGNSSFGNQKRPKETAKSRKERRLMRKQRKPNFELSYKAKKIWEKLRIQKGELTKSEKAELVQNIMTLCTDEKKTLLDLCHSHDTARVVQTCLKQGSREQRHKLFLAFQDHVLELSKNRYAKNIVWKMIKYGIPDERNAIIKILQENASNLMKFSHACSVVEYAYNNFANAEQRRQFVKRFYGKAFCNYKTSETLSFVELLAAHPDKKELFLNSFKSALEPFTQKTAALKNTLIHKALQDFFEICDDPLLKAELIESLRESLVHLMHTREGAQVSMHCLWHGSKKDRKTIVKTMKEFAEKLSCEEFGHLTLLAAFDCVDDTVLVKKALVQPLMQNINELIPNKYGRKVLLYLFTFRSTSHFVPALVKVLSKGDENASSKKPMELRHRELTEAASPAMIDYVANNLKDFVFDHSRFVFVDAICLNAVGDISSILQGLIELLALPFEPNKTVDDQMHIVEDPCGHMVIKRIIKGESANSKENKVSSFSNLILNDIPIDSLISWSTCNRGTQILLALVESEDQAISSKAKEIIRQKVKYLKKKSNFSSSKILIEKL